MNQSGSIESFLPYAKQSITREEASIVAESLLGDIISRGPKVEQFEREISEYCGCAFAVAFNSATAALQAACYALEASPFDRLITSPNTFIASVGGGMHYHIHPTFVDIDPNTGNLSLEQVKELLSVPQSRGRTIIIPVHFGGVPVNMEYLDRIILGSNTMVIEDAAHALGSSYSDGKKVGCCAYSHMTVFSFHPAKNITTGEGGMVTTNDPELCHLLRRFRNNGIERDSDRLEGEQGPWVYEVKEITGNFNFTEFQAALGLSQLKKLDTLVAKRQQVMAWYQQRLRGLRYDLQLLTPQVNRKVAYHLCIVRINFAACRTDRATVMQKLKAKGIGTQVHYIPLYRHPCLRKQVDDYAFYYPEMEKYYTEALTLPLYPDLTEDDVDRICYTLRQILGR